MSKTIMILHLPEPKVRKKTAKTVQHHKDKTRYSRKAKHKGPWDSSQGPSSFLQVAHRDAHALRKGELLQHEVGRQIRTPS